MAGRSSTAVKSKPSITVSVVFDVSQDAGIFLRSRIPDYGEYLWTAFRDEPRITVSFEIIDAATGRLHFTATSVILAKRAAKVAEQLLLKHNLIGVVTILA